jgi:hypothetical protein
VVPTQSAPNAAPPTPTPDQQADSVLGTNQQELKDFLQKTNQPNWRQGLGFGLTGVADALSRAGGSQSDYEKQYGERVQQGKEGLNAIPGKVAELGKEKFGLSQTLQAQDPNSPYSKTNQRTFGPDLIKMGLTPAQVQRMPASLISDLFAKKVTLEEAKARIAQEGTYQSGMLQNTAERNKAEAAQQAKARETERDKAILSGSSIPFVGPSHAEKQAAAARLAGEESPSTGTSTGPYGQTTTRNGVEYEWSPVTGKYHPK